CSRPLVTTLCYHVTVLILLSLYYSGYPRHPHSFPTRRSSDLQCEQCVIAAATNVHTWVELGAALTDEDLARLDLLAAEALNTERSEEHTSELQSRFDLVCRLLLEKKKKNNIQEEHYTRQSSNS